MSPLLSPPNARPRPSQCYWLWAHGGELDAACEVLKLCGSFLTLLLLGFLFLYYRRKFEHLKATSSLLPQDTLASSGLLISNRSWSFLPEALLCAVHAPPFVSGELSLMYYDMRRGATLSTTLNTDELAAVFTMLARSALLLRCLPYLSGLSSRNNRAYANLNHINVSMSLSVRLPAAHSSSQAHPLPLHPPP